MLNMCVRVQEGFAVAEHYACTCERHTDIQRKQCAVAFYSRQDKGAESHDLGDVVMVQCIADAYRRRMAIVSAQSPDAVLWVWPRFGRVDRPEEEPLFVLGHIGGCRFTATAPDGRWPSEHEEAQELERQRKQQVKNKRKRKRPTTVAAKHTAAEGGGTRTRHRKRKKPPTAARQSQRTGTAPTKKRKAVLAPVAQPLLRGSRHRRTRDLGEFVVSGVNHNGQQPHAQLQQQQRRRR